MIVSYHFEWKRKHPQVLPNALLAGPSSFRRPTKNIMTTRIPSLNRLYIITFYHHPFYYHFFHPFPLWPFLNQGLDLEQPEGGVGTQGAGKAQQGNLGSDQTSISVFVSFYLFQRNQGSGQAGIMPNLVKNILRFFNISKPGAYPGIRGSSHWTGWGIWLLGHPGRIHCHDSGAVLWFSSW